MGAHHAIAFETWQVVAEWRRPETREDGTLDSQSDTAQIRFDRGVRADLSAEPEIPGNSTASNKLTHSQTAGSPTSPASPSTTATSAPTTTSLRTTAPTRRSCPPCHRRLTTCAGSTAVGTDPDPGLVGDCNTLLTARDTLAGTATLNWSKDLAMAFWDGIRTGGNPTRVHMILLTDQDLDGSIPAYLGDLTELRRIDLDETTSPATSRPNWATSKSSPTSTSSTTN